jgi:hypothetical protein
LTLLIGLVYVALAAWVYVKGNEAIDLLMDFANRAGAHADKLKPEAKGDVEKAKETIETFYRVVILVFTGCSSAWGLLFVFAAYRVLSRKGRVLGIILALLCLLSGINVFTHASDVDAYGLAVGCVFAAYGALGVIVLFARGEEFQTWGPAR